MLYMPFKTPICHKMGYSAFAQASKGIDVTSPSTQRNHLQVLSEILYVCKEPQTKVQIIEETGLSMRQLHFCLKYLLKQNMVKFHHRKRTYMTTKEGLRIQQQLPHD